MQQNTDVNIGTIRGEIDIYFRDAGKWIHRPGALTNARRVDLSWKDFLFSWKKLLNDKGGRSELGSSR